MAAVRSGTRVLDQPPPESSSDEGDEETSSEEEQVSEGNEEEEESESEGEEEEKPQAQSSPAISKTKEVQKSQTSSESESGSESESEGEEEEKPQAQSSPAIPKTKKVQKSQTSSESGSESESESANDFTIKPFLTKPTPPLSQKAPESSSKRTLDDVKEKNNKEDSPSPKTQEKKSGPNRLWTDHDQIALLQGMIAYQSQKGADPYSNMSEFYDFVMGALDVTVSKAQVQDKIRRLKKKFFTHCERGDVSTSNPIDTEIFALSKKIWDSKSSSGKSLDVSSQVAVEPNGGTGKRIPEVKNASGSIKTVEASNEKKKKAHIDEHSGEKKKMKKQKTAQGAVEEKDEQTAAERNEGEIDQAVVKGNGKQIAMNGVVHVGMEKGEDFWSKYPHFLNSLSAKYYPLATEETLCIWKEKAALLDCSMADEVEKKWAKVWEDNAKLSRTVADLVSLQTRLMQDEEVTL